MSDRKTNKILDRWFILPWAPSVNTLYMQGPKHGQKFLTRKGKEFKKLLAYLYGSDDWEPLSGIPLEIQVFLIPPDKRNRDLDNYVKAPLDGIVWLNLIGDDSQIVTLHIFKYLPILKFNKGAVLVKIREAEILPTQFIQNCLNWAVESNNISKEDMVIFHAPTKKELKELEKLGGK